jgi:DNA-binding response OmpR family regulator
MDILLVEDNEIIGDAIVSRMLADGNKVEWRKNVANSLAALDSRQYDCVVLDLRLPDGHGFSVLDTLRQRGMDVPVLVLTAFDQVSDRIAGMAHGANDHLVKPFSLTDLSKRVANLVAQRR